MTTPHPDSVTTLVDQLRNRISDEYLKILCSEDDAEFDEALEGVLERAVDHLERNANFLNGLSEDTITAFLTAFLTMPGLRVTQQAHTNGHVDLTIEAEYAPPLRRRLGEAKIYNGPEYHEKGLEQLVQRYETGREGSGVLVEYVKKPNIKGLVGKLKEHMDAKRPCSQSGVSQDHRIHWSFVTRHMHSSGELVRVIHLGCNLYKQ
jgi:hypothetical protein